jgi:hypothetical protein
MNLISAAAVPRLRWPARNQCPGSSIGRHKADQIFVRGEARRGTNAVVTDEQRSSGRRAGSRLSLSL